MKGDGDILVRPAEPADIPAVAGIYGASVLREIASFELAPPSPEEMRRRHAAILAGGYPYLVAELDGRIAGYAYAGPFHTRPAYRWTVENTVYVDPQFQRRGVARALMQRLIAECGARGFRQMIAVIAAGDDAEGSASIRLHRALGFADAGCNRAVGYKHGRWLNTWHLQLALGEGALTPPPEPD